MGRLFWKIFLCVWLAQLAGMAGTGAVFWLERQQREARWAQAGRDAFPPMPPPAPEGRPGWPGPPPLGEPPHRGHASFPFPLLPALGTLLASLLCSALLAWYFAKPIRHLRQAFEAAAKGDLAVRLGAAMGQRRDELADLGRDFDSMAGQLGTLMDSQRRLLHDVSHELRSPLARLQAAIGLARQQPARIDDSLGRIEREGERMNRLVGELLTLSLLEAGVIDGSEEVHIAELLSGIVDDARFEAESSGRRVELECAAVGEVTVQGNGELLHRAIENVVRNAIKHTPEGSGVSVGAAFDPAARQLRLVVADNGTGVAESQLDAIFEPFFRAGRSDSDGHGLGLAIARRVVAASGGSILAANHAEGGLRVTMLLPAIQRASADS